MHVKGVDGFVDFEPRFGELVLKTSVAECLVDEVGHCLICSFVVEPAVPLGSACCRGELVWLKLCLGVLNSLRSCVYVADEFQEETSCGMVVSANVGDDLYVSNGV